MAVIFDLAVGPTLEIIPAGLILLLDPKMWGSRWNFLRRRQDR